MTQFNKSTIISDVLGDYLIKTARINARGRGAYQKKYLYPSVDFMCPTKAFFNFKFSGGHYLEVEQDDDYSYENERAKELGNQIHDSIQHHLKEAGVLKLKEFSLIDEERKIKARLDCIVEVKNQLYLVEIKSVKSYPLKIMINDNAPNEEHQKQLQLYFHLIEKNRHLPEIAEILQGRTLNRGILYYEAKDSQKPHEFPIMKNRQAINDILTYADVVWDAVNRKEKPDFKYDPDDANCMYKCSSHYYKLCHGVDKNAKKEKEILEDSGVWGIADARVVSNEEKFI